LVQYNGGAETSGFAVEEGFAFEEPKTPVLEIGGNEETESKSASAF
jgi:hypothetical protein